MEMEETTTASKEEYQISTRSHQRLMKPSIIRRTPPCREPSEDKSSVDHEDEDVDSNDSKPSSGDEGKKTYLCPICDIQLDDQHEFTLHIRSHNNDNNNDSSNPNLSQFECRICFKVLSSSSSLDRHVLVHSKERPFRCRLCSVTFTTNGNMHRHMRKHNVNSTNSINSSSPNESDAASHSDSSSSSTAASGSTQSTPRKSLRRRRYEHNNNNYPKKRKVDSLLNDTDLDNNQNTRRRLKKSINNNNENEDSEGQKYQCPICGREDFASLNVFETHLEESHPQYQIKCHQCNLSFKNHRVLNLHRFMVHHSTDSNNTGSTSPPNLTESKSPKSEGIIGFRDLTFVDFSSEKFPIIAKTVCEQALHKADKNDDLIFECHKCSRAFPCASALEIHQKSCNNYSIKEEEDDHKNSSSEDDLKREDFFAGLDLQNKSSASQDADFDKHTPIQLRPSILTPPNSRKLHDYLTKPHVTDNTKDLADIQSIISVTSTQSLLQQLTAQKSGTPSMATMNLPIPAQITPPDSEARINENQNEEETQDQFAAEFRKMKLRGEFPCRLCSAVFPNLRALKGHNRAHLSGAGSNGPYRCNMCPHSSVDKAALVRHMRTHNGDRPYECSLCNYAFTTKANCERHLRNRHGKVTREDVKRAIIYHPSEDPTNDEAAASLNKMFNTTPSGRGSASLLPMTPTVPGEDIHKIYMSDVKRSLVFPTPPLSGDIPPSTGKLSLTDIRSVISKLPIPNQTEVPLSLYKDDSYLISNLTKANNLKDRMYHSSEESQTGLTIPKIQVKNVNELKSVPEYNSSDSEDEQFNKSTLMTTPLSHFSRNQAQPLPTAAPIDLSMDVLDLSKKKRDPTPEPASPAPPPSSHADESEEDQPHDFTKKTLNETIQKTRSQSPQHPLHSLPLNQPNIFDKTQQLLLAQQLFKNNAINSNLYAAQLQHLYSNRDGVLSGPPPPPGSTPQFPFGINPYFLQPHPFLTPTTSPQDFQEIKERIQKEIIRGLQMSGGGLIMDQLASERLQAFQKQSEQMTDTKYNSHMKSDESKSLDSLETLVTNNKSSLKMNENIISATPNSVKMVIKNGVLMPKQKQRRYRTERPFSCEHCSARFTLRSNMERHIKQQHPQFWSQRQRSNLTVGLPGRKPSISAIPPSQFETKPPPISNILNNSLEKNLPNPMNMRPTEKKAPLLINDQVKYAILAQQLKQLQNTEKKESSVNEDDDDEERSSLIIDENSQQSSQSTDMEKLRKTESLEQKLAELRMNKEKLLKEETKIESRKDEENAKNNEDLVPVSQLLDNAAQIPFRDYFRRETEDVETPTDDEEEEGLVASGSTSEGNVSGSDGNKSESDTTKKGAFKTKAEPSVPSMTGKKKSAYSLAPNRVTCPYCHRKFPWSSSLRRHILTHTGQKPFKCLHCPLLFTTKSNCDRHLLRKHGNMVNNNSNGTSLTVPTNASPTSNESSVNNANYLMRNVPERPYKCSSCPSSTFSTLSNLKKHMSCKHNTSGNASSHSRSHSPDAVKSATYDSHSSEDEYQKKDGWEQQINFGNSIEHSVGSLPLPVSVSASDLPFKCHLCEGSYGDRQEALDHIKDYHAAEYELLLSKGALENQPDPEHGPNVPNAEHNSDEPEEQANLRGKFPDYANRKVMCAFCMRRFWSAEDLRRHMRTHTGERPFSCDVCRRRFTLKHSMLRHRKKHGDLTEEGFKINAQDVGSLEEQHVQRKTQQRRRRSSSSSLVPTEKEEDDIGDNGDGDLIGNLLGIQDSSIIDKVLRSSADDAAKLLGMKKNGE